MNLLKRSEDKELFSVEYNSKKIRNSQNNFYHYSNTKKLSGPITNLIKRKS